MINYVNKVLLKYQWSGVISQKLYRPTEWFVISYPCGMLQLWLFEELKWCIECVADILLICLCSRNVRRLESRWFLCYWRVCLLRSLTLYETLIKKTSRCHPPTLRNISTTELNNHDDHGNCHQYSFTIFCCRLYTTWWPVVLTSPVAGMCSF